MYKLYLIYDRATGIVDKAAPDVEGSLALNVAEWQDFIAWDHGVVATLPDYSWVEVVGGVKTLHTAPARPPHHEWDWPTKSWLPDLPAAISARKAEIDVERDRRISLPLLYDGKNLDADARARENLKSKLEEIKSREALNQPMPQQMMVWRDADNVTHSWPTQEAYKAWLEGFAVTMSERGTMIYAACWAHKGNIGALTSVEDVLNYNATIGWPS